MHRKLADQVNIYIYIYIAIRRHERLLFLPALEDVKQKHVRRFPIAGGSMLCYVVAD